MVHCSPNQWWVNDGSNQKQVSPKKITLSFLLSTIVRVIENVAFSTTLIIPWWIIDNYID